MTVKSVMVITNILYTDKFCGLRYENCRFDKNEDHYCDLFEKDLELHRVRTSVGVYDESIRCAECLSATKEGL